MQGWLCATLDDYGYVKGSWKLGELGRWAVELVEEAIQEIGATCGLDGVHFVIHGLI